MKTTPKDLSDLTNQYVKITVTKNRNFVGKLVGYDVHMNVVISDVTLPSKETRNLYTVIRGDTIETITPFQEESVLWECIAVFATCILSANLEHNTSQSVEFVPLPAENHAAESTVINNNIKHSIDSILNTPHDRHSIRNNFRKCVLPQNTISGRFQPYVIPRNLPYAYMNRNFFNRDSVSQPSILNTPNNFYANEMHLGRIQPTLYNQQLSFPQPHFNFVNRYPWPVNNIYPFHEISKDYIEIPQRASSIPQTNNISNMLANRTTSTTNFSPQYNHHIQKNSNFQRDTNKDRYLESGILGTSSLNCNEFVTPVVSHMNKNNSCTTSIKEPFRMSEAINIVQNTQDMMQAKGIAQKEPNDSVPTHVKYVSTADNSQYITTFEESQNIKGNLKRHNEYIREFSMTRFKITRNDILEKLKLMQMEYEDMLRSLLVIKESAISDEDKKSKKILYEGITEYVLAETNFTEQMKTKILDLIFGTIDNVFQHMFQTVEISTQKIESRLVRLSYSVNELENLYSDEINKIKISEIEIQDILKTCSTFVDYEKQIFGDLNISTIQESLKIPRITETLSRIKECMKNNMIYEILKFLELYEVNLQHHIKKNHLVSTIYLLNVLIIHLEKIDFVKFYHNYDTKTYGERKYVMCVKVFFIGTIFENILRNLNDHDTKANCYGILNVCRTILSIVSFNKKRGSLLSLQLPCLIAMVLEEAFEFDKKQLKEFVIFLFYLMKKTVHREPDFYDDKIQYFLQINISIIENIVNTTVSFINEYKDSSFCNNKVDRIRIDCQMILENESDSSKSGNEICRKLKRLYISQLYYMIISRRKNSTNVSLDNNNVLSYVLRHYKRILSKFN
ncbi:LSM domain-containing protein [Hamiltosporidium magnivora]|uniref:LSM domain-containing protein n=1 Tax=Hamiltosporidium magnivora TaxID=148818 RepID=A0A4Q9LIK3_9MICR|nr:LSM domain-containing protein [Hamiltosporidium magnivora]